MIPTALPALETIIKTSGLHPSRVFNVYLFGSRIYGTADQNSDWDVIMVANNSVESTEIRRGLFNIHVYTPAKFQADLDWHRINNLECMFAPEWAKLKETIKFSFKLNITKLRHSISHVSSNSWVKSKKKIMVANDYKSGIKSLFHSIRVVMFGIQIASTGKIYNFECANDHWKKITSRYNWKWEELDNEFRQIHNNVLTEFRLVANIK